jgi:hypothetical protein
LVLDPGEFYILASKQAVRVPADHAAEMLAYDTAMGEFRVHYAGFFDPGFGHVDAGGEGTRAVLEVRSHEVPFVLEDGQRVGRLVYERLIARPDRLYGEALGSSYQRQGLALSKHFRADLSRHASSSRHHADGPCPPTGASGFVVALGGSERARSGTEPAIPGRPSTHVTGAAQAAAREARLQLGKIVARDLVEGQAEIAGQDGDVPQHVTQLVLERVGRRPGEVAALVAQHLLDLAGDLARLARQAERRIDHAMVLGVDGRALCGVLVIVEIHPSSL